MTGHLLIFTLSVLLTGVFAADDVSLSVEEGESVTLHIKTDEIQGADDLFWFFNGSKNIIAKIDLEGNKSSVPGNKDVEQFRNKLKLDHQTGSLTISDVRSTNTGEYRLEISRRSGISDKRFNVTLNGVFGADDVSLSVEEGGSVTLHIKTDEIQGAHDLLWFFNGNKTFIAEIDLESNQSSVPGNKDVEQFRNKLKLDHQTGSLTISDVRSTNTGEYRLEISRRSGISNKRFNVTLNVKDQRSHWMITGPVLAVVLLLLLVMSLVIYMRYRKRAEML